jgi:hypothetical protein
MYISVIYAMRVEQMTAGRMMPRSVRYVVRRCMITCCER